MHTFRLVLLFTALNAIAPAGGPLQVLRVTPGSPASPNAVVTVTFDRPVAGGLDATVDARAIFSIDPAVPGTIEWRDPITLRFTPAAPLTPGASYRIRIDPGFQAMDGSRLARAYGAEFRVAAPRVLGGEPTNQHKEGSHLPATPTFVLLISAPVDPGLMERMASIRLAAGCGADGGAGGARAGESIAVRVVEQRRIEEDDPRYFIYMGYDGPYPRDAERDLRRVVELEPVEPLPLACAGILYLPIEFDPGTRERTEWRFRTYAPLRQDQASGGCGGSAPTGPLRIAYSSPVRGAEV
jgi:hypothetical protein